MYIAIAGNIGSGKSLMAELLSARLGLPVVDTAQSDEQNPYIDDFYEDMPRWSFHLQIYFLGLRLRTLQRMVDSGEGAIVDRTIYEDAEIFARNLHNSGLLSSRDWKNFYELYNLTISTLPAPDLLIYIRASTPLLMKNITKRARSYETSIEAKYLDNLSELYEDWTFSYSGNLMIVDIDQEDFVRDSQARTRLLANIEREISAIEIK